MKMPDETTYTQNMQQGYHSGLKPCCSSCAKGGPCIGSDSVGEAASLKHDGNDYKFVQGIIAPHRQGGVIPNYTGHIPGKSLNVIHLFYLTLIILSSQILPN